MALQNVKFPEEELEADVKTVLALLLLRGRTVLSVERIDVCRALEDSMILEVPFTAEADVIVSGDEDIGNGSY
jgi:predicted nucleic acid-binding protein